MNCKECNGEISVDDYLAYDGLCPYCSEVRYQGKCSAEFSPAQDGNCYKCMFWVDEACPYLIIVDTKK